MKKIALFLACVLMLQLVPALVVLGEDYAPQNLTENVFNLNVGWKFKKADVPHPMAEAMASMVREGKAFYEIGYDDSDWENVSVPHAPNAEDSFDNIIKDAGEASLYRGYMMYRKHFTLGDASDKKFILEFEAIRQTIYLYINGSFVGYYEAGTAPVGFDISSFVTEGDNLIALITDNCAYRGTTFTTAETIPGNTPGDHSGWGFQWNQKDFNEVQGGITGNVNLYVTSLIYQTRPLYNNLKTTGNYVYATDFDLKNKSATINVKAEVRNESGTDKDVTLNVYIKDGDKVISAFSAAATTVKAAGDTGVVFETVVPFDAYSENPVPTNADTVDVTYITATSRVDNLNFWSIDNPYLYDVITTLTVDGEVIDTQIMTTGFREVIFDIDNGGLLINGESTYLKGYAQRSTNEWAVIGVANDWLSDYDMQLVRESGANFIRWMHVSPKPVAIRAGDKYGVVSVCPAGDKEADSDGRSWDMRMEAMRNAIIYFRNSPSVIFYEAGNAAISPEHMQEMTDMRKLLDPFGGRFMGSRSITTVEQLAAAEWVGTMIYRYDSWAKGSMYELNKHMPMIETEYKRDEAPRRVWDDYSPPYYDYVNKWLGAGAKKTDGYDVWDLTQEDMSVTLASEGDGYGYFYHNRVGGSTGNDYYSGAAMMVWSDSNMHGRNAGSENARTSGRVDPVRIKKESFYAVQAMHSEGADIHIIGHWNYPQNTEENYNYNDKVWNGTYWEYTDTVLRRDPTKKTVYVIGTERCDRIDLYINGALVSSCSMPRDTFVFEFPDIDVTQSGYISAIAYSTEGKIIGMDRIDTAGPAAGIRLTPVTGPEGLRADGSDICYVDVEVVDENGNVCPLAYDKINFTFEGEGEFLGGYNSGTFDDTSVIHKDYCYAECGVNRVFVRSSNTAGAFTLTATIEGLPSSTITVESVEFKTEGGMSTLSQQAYPANVKTEKEKTLFDTLVEKNVKNAAVRKKSDVYKLAVIKNAETGKMLAVVDGKLTTIEGDENTPEALWKMSLVGNETYSLRNVETSLCIDVPGLSTNVGEVLIVYASNSGDNQKWQAKYDENNLATFVSKSSGLTMEPSDDSIVQNEASDALSQRWIITEIEEKDVYTVKVNGTEVEFKTPAYRPDSSTGVLCEVRSVLDALGVDYTYETEGKVKLTITSSGASLKEGETTINIGAESNLTNAEFYVENGEIIAEISAVLNYVDAVEVVTDTDNKTVEISN
ncbi:MAG: RICIN domain-containing protein [Clostridia bacterium]|nr:RICIN domain-containing protein [Clostridia bacterium]